MSNLLVCLAEGLGSASLMRYRRSYGETCSER
jgi:hypothetical protein